MSFIDAIKQVEGKKFAKQMINEYMKKKKLTIEEFIKQNPDYKSFEKNTRGNEIDYANIIKNHGVKLDQQLYEELLQEIKEEEKNKNKINVDVETTKVNGHEITTVTDTKTGEQKIFDNTVSSRTIENQMKSVQKEHKQFQNEKENNTLGIMNYMEDNIKITPKTTTLNNLNSNTFNNEENNMINIAKKFENEIDDTIRIDINQGFLYTKNKTFSIVKKDNTYQIVEGELLQKPKEKIHTLSNTQTMNRKRDINE